MAEIAVHPVENDEEQDVLHLSLVLRIKLLDVVTGEPIKDGYAIKPELLVLNARPVKFTNNDTGDFTVNFKTLRTFVPADGASDPPSSLKPTWQVVPEVFCPKSGGNTLVDDAGNVFQQVDADDQRYVCIKSATVQYCEPSMITNQQGILEIPIPFADWMNKSTVTIELRDYSIAQAEGNFGPEVGQDKFQVSLIGDPPDNNWTLIKDQETVPFLSRIEYPLTFTSLASHLWDASSNEPDLVLWAVRKVKECTSTARTKSTKRPGAGTVRGIVVHYNSGYFISERRGTGTVRCRDVFDNADRSWLQDNKYFSSPELCLHILQELFHSGRTGYHYHIDRTGEIMAVVNETRRCYHSGSSREPSQVVAERAAGQAQSATYNNSNPTEKLDNTHIGINITGHHAASQYHFTDHQQWYLDRLIENIRSRRQEVEWHTILGHDEIRAAYKAAHPSSGAHPKQDPGTALSGGMKQLRGRHGANFT
jgi:hypothetical protein